MIHRLVILENLERLEILVKLVKLEIIKKMRVNLRHRRSPQLGHSVVELLRHLRVSHAEALCGGELDGLLHLVLWKIALSKEDAKQAVVVVMMNLTYVSDTLQAVVVGINCLVMHMRRRQHHHWQIAGQQQKRCKMSQKTVHISACKSTSFSSISQYFFSTGATFEH